MKYFLKQGKTIDDVMKALQKLHPKMREVQHRYFVEYYEGDEKRVVTIHQYDRRVQYSVFALQAKDLTKDLIEEMDV